MALKQLFEELMFQVHVYTDSTHDLSAKNLKRIIQDFSKLSQHEDAQCCVVCFMSHGEEGYLTSKEGGKLLLDDIFSMFSNINCPRLAGKPKVFFIQSCRDDPLSGPSEDHGIHVNLSRAQIDANLADREHSDGLAANQLRVASGFKPNSYHMPTLCDILIGFPTQKGFIAYRKPEIGSWYMNAIVQVFSKHAKNMDVCAMLNMVNSMISQEVTNSGKKQMSEYTSNFTKPYLYFYPGLCISSEMNSGSLVNCNVNLRKENSLLDVLMQTRHIKRPRNECGDFFAKINSHENDNNLVQIRKDVDKNSIFNFNTSNAKNMIFKPNLSLINKRSREADCASVKLNFKDILTHRHKMFMAEKAGHYWKEMAREMDLEEAQIKHIDASVDTKENKLYEAINLWIIVNGHSRANLTSLVQVLANLSLNAIKEDFIENIEANNFPHVLEENA